MQSSKHCVLCHHELDWSGKKSPQLHHNHQTGKVIGFAHHRCNVVEGRGKTEEAIAFREFTYVDPDISDVAIDGVWVNGKLAGQPVKKEKE